MVYLVIHEAFIIIIIIIIIIVIVIVIIIIIIIIIIKIIKTPFYPFKIYICNTLLLTCLHFAKHVF